jgi:hypothetical protein
MALGREGKKGKEGRVSNKDKKNLVVDHKDTTRGAD